MERRGSYIVADMPKQMRPNVLIAGNPAADLVNVDYFSKSEPLHATWFVRVSPKYPVLETLQ